jgi:hypothetical protein
MPSAGGRPQRLLERDDASGEIVADRLADHHSVEHSALGHFGHHPRSQARAPAAAPSSCFSVSGRPITMR